MNRLVSPLIAAVADPPIGEAQGWIAGRTFPSQKPLIDVSQAAPGYPPPDGMIEAMAEALRRPATHRYAPIPGLPSLRQALADDINAVYARSVAGPVGAEDVLISAGCNQAYCLAIAALAQPGDEVILPLPYYFNHQMWLQMSGIGARLIPFRPEHAGAPDLAAIAATIGPRTRALVLISPNNPTGAVCPPDVIADAFDLCRDAGIALILDETYRDFRAEPGPPHSLFQRPDWRRTLVHLYSFSKVFSLPGHRVGAVVAEPALIRQIAKAMDTLALCAPHLGQVAAEWGLAHLADWRAANNALMQTRRAAMLSAFARPDLGGWSVAASGAYFAWLEHPHDGRDAKTVARSLANEHNLLALPGSMFGPGHERYLRLAFANVEADVMPEIAARLAADALAASRH